jgi:hypothetical protein
VSDDRLTPVAPTMQHDRARWIVTTAVSVLLASAAPVRAQGFEVAPFGGYRFGGDLFEVAAGHRLDADGAPALGVVVDVPMGGGLQFEGLFSHQQATVLAPIDFSGPVTRWEVSVDHWQAGGLQEFGVGHVRPFLTGVLGLTRYGVEADSEIRFTVGAGGGAKLFPASHIGVRLDGRLFATFVDLEGRGLACVNGSCVILLHADVAWQAEFTAGLVVRLP